jgi:hypothetical protein
VIVDPLCEVEGEISVFEPTQRAGASPRTISFAGSGFHDHRYGTRPPPAADWFGGRVLLDDRALAFEQVGDAHAAHATLISASKDAIDVNKFARVGRDRDDDINVGMIHLTRPRVLDADRYQTLLAYDARVGGEGGVALCRKLHRRRWIPA